VDSFLRGTEPEEVEQDVFTGKNDMVRAKATLFFYFMDGDRTPDFSETLINAWEQELQDRVIEFSAESK